MKQDLQLYGMRQQAMELKQMLFNDEIDKETFELQLSFYKEELIEKAPSIIEVYKHLDICINNIDDRIKELKEYKDYIKNKLYKFSERVKETMLINGIESGKTNGILTNEGIIYLHKSQKSILPKIDEVIDKYKIYKTKELKFTFEEFEKLPEWAREKLNPSIKEIVLNKELYEEEQTKIKKEANYTLKIG